MAMSSEAKGGLIALGIVGGFLLVTMSAGAAVYKGGEEILLYGPDDIAEARKIRDIGVAAAKAGDETATLESYDTLRTHYPGLAADIAEAWAAAGHGTIVPPA